MVKIGLLSVLVLCCVVFPLSVAVADIQPGTYNLEWRTDAPQKSQPFFDCGGTLSVLRDRERAMFTGLKSENACMGDFIRVLVFIDESKGTGTGYDVGYIIPAPKQMDGFTADMAQATAFPLLRDGDSVTSDLDHPFTLDMPVGPAESDLRKPVHVEFRAQMLPESKTDQDSREQLVRVMSAQIILRGGWFGNAKSDGEDLPVQTLDLNFNGIYGEMAVKGSGNVGRTQADGLGIAGGMCRLGKAISFDGKLYEAQVSPIGDTLTIRPFTGDVGTVKMVAKNGYGKPTDLEHATLSGEGGSYHVDSNEEPSIPAGSYICESAAILPRVGGVSGSQSGVSVLVIKPGKPVVVAPNQTTTLALGGPIRLDILSKSKVLEVRRGGTLKLEMVLVLENGKVLAAAWSGKRRPSVEVLVKSDKGKEIARTIAKYGWAAHWFCDLRIPSDCPPGNYKVIAAFDPSPYQKPLKTVKTLKVVK